MNKCVACNNEEELPEGRMICYKCEKELNELAKTGGSLPKPKEIRTNALYEYLEAKLVKGQCMDNDIATELRCMTEEEIMTVILEAQPGHKMMCEATITLDTACNMGYVDRNGTIQIKECGTVKDYLANGNAIVPKDVWQEHDNKTIKGIK